MDFTETTTASMPNKEIRSPRLILSESVLEKNGSRIATLCERCSVKLLFSLKPIAVPAVLDTVKKFASGFAVSSLADAELASRSNCEIVSMVAPVLIPHEIEKITSVCDVVICNSIKQLDLLSKCSSSPKQIGLRVNPKLSFLADPRYDPCAAGSRLGIPIDQLAEHQNDWKFDCVDGLHFHTNCDSNDFAPLLETAQKILKLLGPMLDRCAWINLGGGYLFEEEADTKYFEEAVALFRSRGLEVFIEPGAALVREAGTLVSTVLDFVKNDGKMIAILDTTVNHMPEVFEYQFEPDVLNTVEDGKFGYVLAGRSCLAGDIFGEYSFERPIKIGDSIVFPNAGAYTVPKWNQFNGIPFPTVYLKTTSGELKVL